MNTDVQIAEERPAHFYRLDDRHVIDLEGIRVVQFIPWQNVDRDNYCNRVEIGYVDGLSIVLWDVNEDGYQRILEALHVE